MTLYAVAVPNNSASAVASVTGTANRITVSGTATDPVIDISSAYVGQATITTLGTIGTGVWHGTAIADTYIASAAAWNAKVDQSTTVNGHALSGNVTVTASDVGLGSVENAAASGLYVPLTRTVNGLALSANITITTITGNAGTATALQNARTINGTSFDGTANITVTAAASTLTGSTLASGVTASSLTSFGASPTLSSPVITGGSHTAATDVGTGPGIAVATGKRGFQYWLPYVSTRFYSALNMAAAATGTNTTPLVDGTVYTALAFAGAPITIKSISFRTSSSNASNGASVKIGVYASDGVNGTPGTLLGSTASGTAITNSAVSTDFTINLDSPTAVPAGPFWIAILQTSTTGVRTAIQTGAVASGAFNGATSATNALGGTTIFGYTVAQAYASGMPSPFGTAVANTNNNLTPHFVFEIN